MVLGIRRSCQTVQSFPGLLAGAAMCSDRRGTVPNLEDFDFLVAGRGSKRRNVAVALLEQGARDGGNPAHVPALGIHFIHADDLDRALLASAVHVGIRDGGAEEDQVRIAPRYRIDDLRGIEATAQKMDPPVYLAQPLLPVEVIAA